MSFLVRVRWKRETMAPSNSAPLPLLMVWGEKAFQMIVSQMLVAMKREVPDPKPYLERGTREERGEN